MHGRYDRRPADPPAFDREARPSPRGRRFYRRTADRPRRSFTERPPGPLAPRARRTRRPAEVQARSGAALGGAAAADFARLGDCSCMTPQADGRLVMHAPTREELRRRERAERPEPFERVHRAPFEWHDARCRPEGPRAADP